MRVKIEDKEQNPYPPALLRQAQHIAFPFKRERGAKPPKIRGSCFFGIFPPLERGDTGGILEQAENLRTKQTKSLFSALPLSKLSISLSPSPTSTGSAHRFPFQKGKGSKTPKNPGIVVFLDFPPFGKVGYRGDIGINNLKE
jgi:hypothetical protein